MVEAGSKPLAGHRNVNGERHRPAEPTCGVTLQPYPGAARPTRRSLSVRVLPRDHVMNRLRPYLTALLLGLPALPAVADEETGLITSYPFRDSFARHYQVKGSPRIVIGEGISGPV